MPNLRQVPIQNLDERGVPMGINQQMSNQLPMLGGPSGAPLGYKGTDNYIVPPKDSSNIEIISKNEFNPKGASYPLPPKVQEYIDALPNRIEKEEAKNAFQTLYKIFEDKGQKKNLEGGFSKIAAVLGVTGITGLTSLATALFKGDTETVVKEQEVSPVKEEPKVESIVEKYAKIKENTPQKGQFTMYNPEPGQTDSTPNILASGKTIKQAQTEAKEKGYDGIVAAGFRPLPLGTIVFIPELGKKLIVEDRMNERYNIAGDYRFDLISDSKEEAKQFGRKDLSFEILGHDGRENTKIDTSVLKKK